MNELNATILVNSTQNISRKKAFFLCCIAYVLSILTAIIIGVLISPLNAIWLVLIADIGATLVIYVFSCIYKNGSFYDPYWSVQPLFILGYWFILSGNSDEFLARKILTTVVVFLWSIRLTMNWAKYWQGLQHEDWRYRDFRIKNKNIFWFINLTGIELLPTFLVFFGCLPLYSIFIEPIHTITILEILGLLISIGAILIEWQADLQMHVFTKSCEKGEICNKKLWRYSRHPNYFGEISFWWGIYFIGLSANTNYWYFIIGPALITLLFLFISIPMMEKRQLQNKPLYQHYQAITSMLIPWLPKKEK